MIPLMKALMLNAPSRTAKLPQRADARARAIPTGESEETLKAFTEIHRSKRFTAAAAHQAFAGVKRKK